MVRRVSIDTGYSDDPDGWAAKARHIGFPESLKYFGMAIDGYRKFIQDGQTNYVDSLITTLTDRARLLSCVGQLDASVLEYGEAICCCRPMIDPSDTHVVGGLATALLGRARALLSLDQIEAASRNYDQAADCFDFVDIANQDKWSNRFTEGVTGYDPESANRGQKVEWGDLGGDLADVAVIRIELKRPTPQWGELLEAKAGRAHTLLCLNNYLITNEPQPTLRIGTA